MKFIPSSLTRLAGRQILILQKHSPRLMFVGGIVGIGVGTVLACRATLKLEETLDDIKEDVVKAETRQEHTIEVFKGGVQLIRLYTPAIIVGGASIGLLTASHVTLGRRNAAITAAYSGLQASFDQYIARVKEEIGEERERDLRHGITRETIKVDGKNVEVAKVDPNGYSQYAKIFGELNPNWKKDPEYNRIFIQCQQNHMNQILQTRGHVFLNEVYDYLGFDHTKAGAVVGWLRGKDGGRDGFIDFGMLEVNNERFINGWEPTIILDFNVDGIIYDKI